MSQVVHTFEKITLGILLVGGASDDKDSWNQRVLGGVVHIGRQRQDVEEVAVRAVEPI